MNPAEFALKNKATIVILTLVVAVAGVMCYFRLGRLENPDFVIKTAVVYTTYPGASAEEVEQEVTDTIEEAIQSLGELLKIESTSRDGLSVIHAEMRPKYSGAALQQVWDKLRRKVNDIQSQLPPGAGPSVVNDDFSDVYGLYYAIIGDEYSYEELKEYAKELKKELLRCEDVAKVDFWGTQPEVIYIEVSQARMAELGISPQMIMGVVQSQNIVQPSGNVLVGDDYLRIEPTGEFNSEQRIGDLLIASPITGRSIRLRDIADVRRGYLDPPQQLMRFNGHRSIGLGISTVFGGNAVTMANAVKTRLKELEPSRPPGMNVDIIYDQGGIVDEAVNGFVLNLVESVAIVIVLLLVFMGMRSGLLIGGVLILTILATFVYMWITDICLQKISLGALILALGMLVDNAIVVVEGVLIKIQQGMSHREAAIRTVGQTQWPLLGATVIAALAFAAIGFSPGNVGEFCSTLFWVLACSLLLSWVTAVTVTPILCVWFLKAPKESVEDPYDSPFFRIYRRNLCVALRFWPVTLAAVAGSVVAAMIAFQFVPSFFFAGSTQPRFTVDLWRPEGIHITKTAETLEKLDDFVRKDPAIANTAIFVGQGSLRFLLSYTPQDPNPSYGQLLVTVKDYDDRAAVIEKVDTFIKANFADIEWRIEPFKNGPPYDAEIEARFHGPDKNVLRDLANQAQEIMREFDTETVRQSWRNRVCVLRPRFTEAVARRTGLTRNDLANVLRMNFGGQRVGVYREKDDLLPIVVRSPHDQHDKYMDARKIHAWSEVHNKAVPLDAIVSDWTKNSTWEDPILKRRHRKREIIAQCDPRIGLSEPLRQKMQPLIEAIPLPPGYTLDWGGEFEESNKGKGPLAAMFPICMFGMFLILVVMFNGIREPLIIFLCLPLISIGVTAGLLLSGIPFGFMAILGYLGLSGMLIKNAIVLLEEIDLNRSKGIEPYQAVLDAAVSRLRPVSMASGTTVLGMTPLLWDPFYQGLAATVAGGLIGSTVLVLLVVPLFYVLFYRVKPEKAG